jgi:hypothetical protein
VKRILYVLLVLVLLSGITGADRLIYSSGLNGSESDVSINQAGISEIYVSDDSTELNISRYDSSRDELEIFNSYRIRSSEDVIDVEIKFNRSQFIAWRDRHGFEFYDYDIIADRKEVIDLGNESGSYSSQIILPRDKAVIHVAGKKGLQEDYTLAHNSDNEFCGMYYDPPSNYTRVQSCNEGVIAGAISGLQLNAIKIVIGLITALLGIGFTLYISKYRERKSIENATEEILTDVENGEINVNSQTLEKLEEINNKAYNGDYDEANKLLQELKSDLDK